MVFNDHCYKAQPNLGKRKDETQLLLKKTKINKSVTPHWLTCSYASLCQPRALPSAPISFLSRDKLRSVTNTSGCKLIPHLSLRFFSLKRSQVSPSLQEVWTSGERCILWRQRINILHPLTSSEKTVGRQPLKMLVEWVRPWISFLSRQMQEGRVCWKKKLVWEEWSLDPWQKPLGFWVGDSWAILNLV